MHIWTDLYKYMCVRPKSSKWKGVLLMRTIKNLKHKPAYYKIIRWVHHNHKTTNNSEWETEIKLTGRKYIPGSSLMKSQAAFSARVLLLAYASNVSTSLQSSSVCTLSLLVLPPGTHLDMNKTLLLPVLPLPKHIHT